LTSMGKRRESREFSCQRGPSGRRSCDEGDRFNTNSNRAGHREIALKTI
jgi:hypothetical protein